jgi:hypothetical protein
MVHFHALPFHVRLGLRPFSFYLFTFCSAVLFRCFVLEIPTNLPLLLTGFFSLHVTYLEEKHNFVFCLLFHAVDRFDASVFRRTRLKVCSRNSKVWLITGTRLSFPTLNDLRTLWRLMLFGFNDIWNGLNLFSVTEVYP